MVLYSPVFSPLDRSMRFTLFETVAKGDSNPGSLDCEFGVLRLSLVSYRAPQSGEEKWERNNIRDVRPETECRDETGCTGQYHGSGVPRPGESV